MVSSLGGTDKRKDNQMLSMEHLISIEKLDSLLSQNTLRKKKHILIVDTRTSNEYLKGHIPGSINIDLMQFHWLDTSFTGIKQFNRQTRLLLSNIGVGNKEIVIFYDNTSGPSAAR